MHTAEIACTSDDFSTLCSAVTAAGLGDALSGGSWTVFAPTNAAFEALGSELLDTVVNDVGLLTDVLLFHVVDEPVYSEDLVCASLIEMANGQDSRTVCHGGNGVDGIFQKGGTNTRDMMPEIVSADIKACNGVIHVVSTFLMRRLDCRFEFFLASSANLTPCCDSSFVPNHANYDDAVSCFRPSHAPRSFEGYYSAPSG